MATTLKDIAREAGVHFSTVSRILRGIDTIQVSNETREKVLAIAKELNYRPNQLARAFRLKKTCSIGLVIPDISNSFFAEIAKSIEMASYNTGYNVMVCNTDENQIKEVEFINDLINRGVDGLIIAPVQDSDDHIKMLLERHFPFVLIDRHFEHLTTNSVISNNEESAYNATNHLIGQGHKKIGFLSGRRTLYTISKRLSGYKKALSDNSLDIDPSLIAGDGYTIEAGYEATRTLLQLPQPPTALLISGNMISIGAIKALTEKGLFVPRDISLIGFTDSLFTPYLSTPLTTISHPLDEIGQIAFDILHKNLISGSPLPMVTKVVQTNFCSRSSVSAPPSH